MRFLVVLLAIAGACDLQPPPKKAPAAATPPQPTPPAVPPPQPTLPPSDAGVADAAPAPPDAMEVSDRCVQLGSHVADVMIREAEDPSKKSVLVQERARIVRRTAEGCTRDGWNEKLISCYLAAKTQAALQACRTPDARPKTPPAVDDNLGPR